MRTIRAGQIQSLFAGNIRKLLEECVIDYEKLYEIRLRTGRPVFLCYGDGEKFHRTGNGMPYRVTRQDLKETLEYISGYSLYAYEDEIRIFIKDLDFVLKYNDEDKLNKKNIRREYGATS